MDGNFVGRKVKLDVFVLECLVEKQHALAKLFVQRIGGLFHHLIVQSGKCQYALGKVYKSVRLVDDNVQVLVALLFGKVGSFQQFGKAGNGNNGSFELVGEVGNEAFAKGFDTTQTFYHVVEFFRNEGVF